MLYSPALEAPLLPALPIQAGVALAALTILLLWFGIYPQPLLELIRFAQERVA
jgi:NADH:ubiquinone oxidoreductase subunit 4 (subunit M)